MAWPLSAPTQEPCASATEESSPEAVVAVAVAVAVPAAAAAVEAPEVAGKAVGAGSGEVHRDSG